LNGGSVVVKASPFPLNGGIGGSEGANEIREQVNGTVEVVENGPRNLAWQHGKHVVHSERHLQTFSHLAAQQRYHHPCRHHVTQAAMIRGRHRRTRFRDATDLIDYFWELFLGFHVRAFRGSESGEAKKDRILGLSSSALSLYTIWRWDPLGQVAKQGVAVQLRFSADLYSTLSWKLKRNCGVKLRGCSLRYSMCRAAGEIIVFACINANIDLKVLGRRQIWKNITNFCLSSVTTRFFFQWRILTNHQAFITSFIKSLNLLKQLIEWQSYHSTLFHPSIICLFTEFYLTFQK